MTAMGVPGYKLPQWDDIQIMTAQMAVKPLLEDAPVATETVIGPDARKPLRLKIPLFVSDMSFGALSEEAKIALARAFDPLQEHALAPCEPGLRPIRFLHKLFQVIA